MSSSTGGENPANLSPAAAFETLGNETRVEILRSLADADGPQTFTTLRDRLGVRQGGEFNYHLDKLVGNFVNKSDGGYSLNLPGSRVVQAVLSVAVPENPVIEPTPLEQACYHCGAPTTMTYSGNHIGVFCTQCSGNYEIPDPDVIDVNDLDARRESVGFLRGYELPPAGVIGRSGAELLRTGETWQNLERLASGIGICPRCSARLETSIRVCETHDSGRGVCDECHTRYAVQHNQTCSNCNYDRWTQLARLLLKTTELLNFLTDHGINPIAPESPEEFMAFLDNYEEEVLSIEPFEGRFTFTIDGDAISITVDEDLNVLAAKTIEEGDGD